MATNNAKRKGGSGKPDSASRKPPASPKKGGIPAQRLTSLELLTRCYVVLMLCIFPLYMNPEKYISLTKHKANFFFVATIAYLALLGILLLVDATRSRHRRHWEKLSAADWAVAAFLLISVLAALFTPYPKYVFLGYTERYDGLLTTLLYGGLYFAISRTYRPKEADLLLFAGSAAIVSAIGIAQFYGADIFSLFPYESFPGSTGRTIIFRTTLGNIDIVSSYAALTVIFFGAMYVRTGSRRRFAYLASGALCVYLMALSSAQAGLIGMAAALVLGIPFFLADRRTFGRALFLGFVYAGAYAVFRAGEAAAASSGALLPTLLRSRVFLAAIALLALSALVLFLGPRVKLSLSPKTIRIIGVAAMVLVIIAGLVTIEFAGRDASAGTIYEAREMLHGNLSDEFGTLRGYIWNRTFDLLKTTPAGQLLIGSGSDTFVDRFMPYYSESVKLYNITYDKAHNEYLQILICQGILGLAAYLVFLGALLARAARRAFERPWLMASGLAAVSYAAQAFFGISVPIATPLFFVMLGTAAALSKENAPAMKSSNPV